MSLIRMVLVARVDVADGASVRGCCARAISLGASPASRLLKGSIPAFEAVLLSCTLSSSRPYYSVILLSAPGIALIWLDLVRPPPSHPACSRRSLDQHTHYPVDIESHLHFEGRPRCHHTGADSPATTCPTLSPTSHSQSTSSPSYSSSSSSNSNNSTRAACSTRALAARTRNTI